MSVGKRILEVREGLNLSQTAFAKAGGVGKGSQINYEKGERAPDTDYLQGIAAVGADVTYIVTGQKRIGAIGTEREAALLCAAIEAVLAKGSYGPTSDTAVFLKDLAQVFQANYEKAAERDVGPGRTLGDAELKLLNNYGRASKEGKRSIERIAALEAGRKGRGALKESAEDPDSGGLTISGHGNVFGSNNQTGHSIKIR